MFRTDLHINHNTEGEILLTPKIIDILNKIIPNYNTLDLIHQSAFGNICYLWQTSSKDYYIKLFVNNVLFQSEVTSYEILAKQISDYIPTLVFSTQENITGIIVTESLGEQNIESIKLPNDEQIHAWTKAGSLLNRINAIESPGYFGLVYKNSCISNPIIYLKKITGELLGHLKACYEIKSDEKKIIDWLWKNISLFENEKPVFINPDYTPGNWLVNRSKKFMGIIDFEKCEWGLRQDGMAHLAQKYITNQDLIKAFFNGYGFNPFETQPKQMKHALTRLGFSNILHGSKTNQNKYIIRGKRILDLIWN